jgi:signal transduction histidine kinase
MSIGASLVSSANAYIDPTPPVSREKVPAAILVVEDEPEILAPLCHALKRAGYIVFEAEDGLTACRMIGSQQPDLILLDILLPDLDGWEVCRMLRQHPEPRIATTPVIMLTALNTPDDKLHGLQLGADAYLPKPYSQQEVLLLSGKLIERHRRQLELEQQLIQLSRAVEQQQDLHHLLFHELRNQLTILHGYTEMLQQDRSEPEDGRLTAIHRSSDYLQSLAEDFQLIRQVQGGELRLPTEPLFVDGVAAEIMELYAPAAHARDITLQLRIDGQARPVHTNRPAIKIILSALLDNAIKYGPSGRPVVIVCRFGDWRVELEVYDEGRGVATDERERVFDRFYRGISPREVSGSGLGLYGVRILATALGGDAEVDSRPARGCCVRAWLPFSGAA